MHPNNPHIQGYDMQALADAVPELSAHLSRNQHHNLTINFANASAVKLLNKALLKHHYGLHEWDIPSGYLCPPIPGRVDYLLYLQDYLNHSPRVKPNSNSHRNGLKMPIKALDIGTGANVVYPLLASRLLQWRIVGSDIDDTALQSAQRNLDQHTALGMDITLRKQASKQKIFNGIIQPDDFFDVTLCNPPFHVSQQAAMAGSTRKNKNLNYNKQKRGSHIKPIKATEALNFAGQSNELWCEGGEKQFIRNMIKESVVYQKQVQIFTCLVSKKETLPSLMQDFKKCGAQFDVVEMAQGNKISRFIAWYF